MRTFTLGALLLAGVVACKSNPKHPDAKIHLDGGSDVGCDPFGLDTTRSCGAGMKCTWIEDGTDANGQSIGHKGCAAAGTITEGNPCHFAMCADGSTPDDTTGLCTDGHRASLGADNCQADFFCLGRKCAPICDNVGSAKPCDSNHACDAYSGLFGAPGQPDEAGICDTLCDPLLQQANVAIGAGGSNACGSVNQVGSAEPAGPNMTEGPNTGCYAHDLVHGQATCTRTPQGRTGGVCTVATQMMDCGQGADCNANTLKCERTAAPGTELEDRDPCTVANGCAFDAKNFFSNGCDPGFILFYNDSTGSTTADCTRWCAPLNTDASATLAGNAQGDATALGKLPTDLAPVAGHAVCQVGKGAKEVGEECRFLWPALLDMNNQPAMSQYNDKLGTCFHFSSFKYDPTNPNNPNPTKVEPSCATLRNGSDGDAGSDSTHPCSNPLTGPERDCFAISHGCYSLATTLGSAAPTAKVPFTVQSYQHYHLATPDTAAFRRVGGIQ
jgi:hypothetical protein